MIYIGDLSSRDAAVLRGTARDAASILEFGVGGSTQIFAQYAPEHARLLSLDTSDEWIARTALILRTMGLRERVMFQTYRDWRLDPVEEHYDLVFDDGIDGLRLDFANRAWPMLGVGGKLIFHDTRRQRDYMNVLQFAANRYLEISAIDANVEDSNLTVITKRHPQPYENWNLVEERSQVMIGCGSSEESVAIIEAALRDKPVLEMG
jgi:predicted O-methyltransferase YrrM